MSGALLDRAALLGRIEEGWRDFRSQVRHLGWARLRERTPVGWTYKDAVAHIAAWEEEAARRLGGLRDGRVAPSLTDADVDAFNARAVEERRLVGAEAILDELESAHRMLVTLIRELPEELLRTEHAQGWIAENTFDHYAEHREEFGAARGV